MSLPAFPGGIRGRRPALQAAAAVLLWCGCAQAAPSGDVAVPPLLERIRILTQPALAGRAGGSAGGRAAGDTLAGWLGACGLRPAFGGGWFQEFPLDGQDGQDGKGADPSGLTGRNVAGILPGEGALAGRFVVVGAHYDHLGRRGGDAPADAAADTATDYFPGANDNASGVSALFDVIRTVSGQGSFTLSRRSLLFVFFDAEEIGLQGSGHLVRHLPVSRDSIDVMVNLDTVGQLNDGVLYVSGVGTSPPLSALVAPADRVGLRLSLAQGGWSGSDHMAFNTVEIPVLFLFGGAYPQYNRPDDRWTAIDPESLAKVAGYAADLVAAIGTAPGPFPWVMVASQSEVAADASAGDRASWLGTLPDFTENAEGYPLAGVFPDSPAARAGLQKGDVLVMMGGRLVVDLATFTTALRAHSPGDLVELTVRREGKTLNFTVVLGNRTDRK